MQCGRRGWEGIVSPSPALSTGSAWRGQEEQRDPGQGITSAVISVLGCSLGAVTEVWLGKNELVGPGSGVLRWYL